MNENQLVLGIETSCDDTGVAVLRGGHEILSSVLSSQIPIHATYGGVVPELASRSHSEHMIPLLQRALEEAGVGLGEIDVIAVTRGPGLVGSLLVGLMTAKGLAWSLDRPLVGVNHLAAHIWAAVLEIGQPELPVPALCLVVSGGHTEILYLDADMSGRLLGQTRDDAAGEAFDKVARVLGLGFPGGPVIDRMASQYTGECVAFPRPMMDDGSFDFSFSGLKTAVAVHAEELQRTGRWDEVAIAQTAASFQEAVVEVLVTKVLRALTETRAPRLIVAGGVAANRGLRDALQAASDPLRIDLIIPSPRYCTDNAAMVAAAGAWKYRSEGSDGWDLDVEPALRLPLIREGRLRL